MIGRLWPFHVARTADDTGRVRDAFTTRPAMRGSASVALDMQILLASAWLVKAITSRAEAATVSAVRISTFPNDSFFSTRAFSVPIESERRLYFFVLTRFLDANRYPLRSKTLYALEN